MGNSLRARNGRYARNPDTAERDAEACRLRLRGLSFRQIAVELGYDGEASAYKAVKRCMDATITEPGEMVKQQELLRLDALWHRALAVAETTHLAVSNGRVVYTKGGPVQDDMPALQAIDRLLKIQERRARLLGLDAPAKTEVRNVDAVDAEIERLVAQLAAGRQEDDAPSAAPAGDARPVSHPG